MTETIAIFGATGVTGSRVARNAAEYGLDVVLIGRDSARLDALAADVPGAITRIIDVSSHTSVLAALAGTRVAVNCLAPASTFGSAVAAAAIEAGSDYVDTTGESAFCLDLHERFDRPAADRGVRLVPAVGVSSLLADFATALALARVDRSQATGVSIGYQVTGWKPSAGSLKSELGILADGTPYVHDGRLTVGLPGASTRHLPNGVGVRMPVPDAFVISRYCDLPEIEAFLIAPAPRVTGFALRGVARLCAGHRTGPRLHALVAKLPDRGDDGTESGRFTVHATVWGSFGAHTTTLSGTEVYRSTARFAAMLASELAARPGDGGVCAPSQVVDDIETAMIAVDLTCTHSSPAAVVKDPRS
jgi:short subunit dehydrogenase-like uncharacterized protein